MPKLVHSYQNGNTHVRIYDNGTKLRVFDDVSLVEFPESLDVKITDYCDMGCKFCHESSTTAGIHADLAVTLEQLSVLPAGIELAIGGGNPLSHPGIVTFLEVCKERGHICNITVNQGHLTKHKKDILDLHQAELINAIGISLLTLNRKSITPIYENIRNVVFHLIAGIHTEETINWILDNFHKPAILILGYKTFGFGINYLKTDATVLIKIEELKQTIKSYLGKATICFDNLAIEQLAIKNCLSERAWQTFYMGDDGHTSMYIDAVKQEFAITSRTPFRVSFNEKSLLAFFKDKRQ